MKKKSHKLVVSMALLLVAIFAVTSTTYAWITMNNNAVIENILLQVDTESDGLFIGVENYTTENHECGLKSNVSSTTVDNYQDLSNDEKNFYIAEAYKLNKTSVLFPENKSVAEYQALPAQIRSAYAISEYVLISEPSTKITAESYASLTEGKELYQVSKYAVKASDDAVFTNTITAFVYGKMSAEAQAFYTVNSYKLGRIVNESTYEGMSSAEKNFYVASFEPDLTKFSAMVGKYNYDGMPSEIQAIYSLSAYQLKSDISYADYLKLTDDYKAIYILNGNRYNIDTQLTFAEYNLLTENAQSLYTLNGSSYDLNASLNSSVTVNQYNDDSFTAIMKGLYVEQYSLDSTNVLFSTLKSQAEFNAMSSQLKDYFKLYGYNLLVGARTNVTEYRTFVDVYPVAKAFYDETAINSKIAVVYRNTLSLDRILQSVQFIDAGITEVNDVLSTKLSHVTMDGNALKTISDEDAANFKYDNKFDALANNDYLNFRLFFRSTTVAEENGGVGVFLVGDGETASEVKAAGQVLDKYKLRAWKNIDAATYGVEVSKGELLNVRAANTVRVGFGGSTSDVTSVDNTKIWDPNATAGFIKNGNVTGNLAQDWAKNVTNDDNVNVGTGVEGNLVTSSKDAISENATNIVTLRQTLGEDYSEGSTWVSIWIEGTDSECFNAILEDKFSTKLSFVALPLPART